MPITLLVRLRSRLGLSYSAARLVKGILTGKVNLLEFESALRLPAAYDTQTRAFEALNEVLGGYGVEYVGSVEGIQGIEYVNRGDTYSATLIYDRRDDLWRVGSWGDLVEKRPRFYV